MRPVNIVLACQGSGIEELPFRKRDLPSLAGGMHRCTLCAAQHDDSDFPHSGWTCEMIPNGSLPAHCQLLVISCASLHNLWPFRRRHETGSEDTLSGTHSQGVISS